MTFGAITRTCSEMRKLAVNTVVLNICALRFLYIKVLKRRDMKEDLPYPKQRLRLPVILSPDEVALLIGAARNLYHRTMLMTLYSTGVRRPRCAALSGRRRHQAHDGPRRAGQGRQ